MICWLLFVKAIELEQDEGVSQARKVIFALQLNTSEFNVYSVLSLNLWMGFMQQASVTEYYGGDEHKCTRLCPDFF